MKQNYARPEFEVTVLEPKDIITISYELGKDVEINGDDLYKKYGK